MNKTAYTLGFDSSGPWCAATLLRGTDVIAQNTLEMTRGQAERLMPMLEDLLRGAKVGWQDLHRIGVGIGPGNFTGIRISVSAARGLALGLKIPAIGVSSFEAAGLGHATPHLATVPAPRNQIYVQDSNRVQSARLAAALPETTMPIHERPAPAALSAAIAHIAATHPDPSAPRPAPLYIKPADAAPAADPPPRILP